MFDFSLGKLLLLALIALLVLGPDKLPGAARTVGAMVRRMRGAWDNVRAEVERELEVEEIRRAARQAADDAEAAQSEASETLRHLHEEVEKARTEAARLQAGIADDARTNPEPAARLTDASAKAGEDDRGQE